jgi:hypothetical protein
MVDWSNFEKPKLKTQIKIGFSEELETIMCETETKTILMHI